MQQVSLDVLQIDFQEDDAYNRDCTAFKVSWVDLYYKTEIFLDKETYVLPVLFMSHTCVAFFSFIVLMFS